MTAPTVTLRNVKEFRPNSEETLCFNATVLIDGVVVGQVSNDGRGGAHRFDPPRIEDRIAQALAVDESGTALDAYNRRSMAVEVAINALVCDALDARDIKRTLASRVVVQNDKGEIRETKRLPKDHVLATARTFVGRPGIVRVLNLLPEDEAIALLRAKAEG